MLRVYEIIILTLIIVYIFILFKAKSRERKMLYFNILTVKFVLLMICIASEKNSMFILDSILSVSLSGFVISYIYVSYISGGKNDI